MRKTLYLGRLFGIRVGIHISWFVVYAFALFSIAASIAEVARPVAIALGAVCALLLFASVLAHEFAHALVARRWRVRTTSIVLFLFGGVATLECEPPTPRAEVAIALAGPAMSGVLSAICVGLARLLGGSVDGTAGAAVALVVAYLAIANGALAVFNLIPAFPMDGGRVVRAAVWQVRKSRAAATGAASLVGLVLAVALVAGGVTMAVMLRAWQDVWYALIGAFVLRQSWLQFREARLAERHEGARVPALIAAGDEAPAICAA